MIHITLALGVVIGGIIYSVIFTLLIRSFSQNGLQAGDIQVVQQIAASGYLVGIVLAYFWLEKISLKTRLPEKIPVYPLLVTGVWFSLLKVVLDTVLALKVPAIYVLAILSTVFSGESILFARDYLGPSANIILSALCLIALLIIFLECDPGKDARRKH